MLIPSVTTSLGIALAAFTCIDSVAAKFAITGVKTGVNTKTGYRPPRRNINDLYNDKPQFSLYIQAMNAMMQTDENNLTSFFQIGGIHGRPFISWDGVDPKIMAPLPNADGIPIGYCTHGNTLFPTWHRPYLALIEQVMAGFAQKIAKTYNSPVYQTAADNLRIPYWDWASVPQYFPDVLMWPSIQISTPTGVTNVTNPLNRYKFLNHPEPEKWFPSNEETYLGSQPWTLRQPDSQNVSHENLINNPGLSDDGPILTDAVYNVFAKSPDWWNASTTASGGNSFEGPHGSIHFFVGGNGHMSPASFAGFDPVFFLHHANVDRLMDMWQAIYPNAWIQPSTTQGGTWTIYPNTIVDENTPLTPFTTGDGKTPYTSVSARHVKSFGYSYPDVQDWLFPTPQALFKNVTTRVNQLYNSKGLLGTWPNKKRSSIRSAPELENRATTVRSWSVAVAAPNALVGEGFTVSVSVGSTRVGRLTVFEAPTQFEKDAGGKRFTHGEYTLHSGLEGIDSNDVASVVKHLKENLKWTVVKNKGGVVDANGLEGLNIEVFDEVVTPAQSIEEFPVFGQKTSHPEVLS
ncbi:hypothetical protein B0J14DRAFT_25463 [Halenospora varia]|nr:hypothetical protein B0J14DRAFT_25463 [Halenospora varia]